MSVCDNAARSADGTARSDPIGVAPFQAWFALSDDMHPAGQRLRRSQSLFATESVSRLAPLV